MDWEIETYGYLLDFKPNLQIYNKITQITTYIPEDKRWQIGVGMSNQMNTKIQVGYKGWNVEPVFSGNKNFKFQELYLTKTFKF